MVSEDVQALVARVDALAANAKAHEEAALAAQAAQRVEDVQALTDAVGRAETPAA